MEYSEHFTPQHAEMSTVAHESLQRSAANTGTPKELEPRGPQNLQLAIRGNHEPLPAHDLVAKRDGVD